MRAYFILFLLVFVIFSCQKEDDLILIDQANDGVWDAEGQKFICHEGQFTMARETVSFEYIFTLLKDTVVLSVLQRHHQKVSLLDGTLIDAPELIETMEYKISWNDTSSIKPGYFNWWREVWDHEVDSIFTIYPVTNRAISAIKIE